jgi:hypothetical protein
LVHKAQNRNVLLLAGKACNKLPAYGRKKPRNPAGLRPQESLQSWRPTAGY